MIAQAIPISIQICLGFLAMASEAAEMLTKAFARKEAMKTTRNRFESMKKVKARYQMRHRLRMDCATGVYSDPSF